MQPTKETNQHRINTNNPKKKHKLKTKPSNNKENQKLENQN